jgi:hypothetical protein
MNVKISVKPHRLPKVRTTTADRDVFYTVTVAEVWRSFISTKLFMVQDVNDIFQFCFYYLKAIKMYWTDNELIKK